MACEQITVAGVQLSQVMRSWEANISMATQAIIVSRGHTSYVPLELSSRVRSTRYFRQLDDLAEDFLGTRFRAFPGQSITKYNE